MRWTPEALGLHLKFRAKVLEIAGHLMVSQTQLLQWYENGSLETDYPKLNAMLVEREPVDSEGKRRVTHT